MKIREFIKDNPTTKKKITSQTKRAAFSHFPRMGKKGNTYKTLFIVIVSMSDTGEGISGGQTG